jgi:hypothetical protein
MLNKYNCGNTMQIEIRLNHIRKMEWRMYSLSLGKLGGALDAGI